MVLKYLINLPVGVHFRDILTDTWKLINHMLLKLTLVKFKKIYIYSFNPLYCSKNEHSSNATGWYSYRVVFLD